MKRLLRKKWIVALLPATVLTAFAALSAQMLLRNLSLFLSFDTMFSRIFSQLRDGNVDTSVVLLWAAAYGFSLLLVCLWGKKRRKLVLAAGMVFFLMLTVAAMLLTSVNDVLFGDVVVSLLDVLRKGGLDGL